jgi:hypothetical protein
VEHPLPLGAQYNIVLLDVDDVIVYRPGYWPYFYRNGYPVVDTSVAPYQGHLQPNRLF